MMWIHAESTLPPALVDAKACPGKVYVRKGIRTEIREGAKIYTYQEALMTPEEYQGYSGGKMEETGTNDNQTIIMSALADIMEMIMEMQ